VLAVSCVVQLFFCLCVSIPKVVLNGSSCVYIDFSLALTYQLNFTVDDNESTRQKTETNTDYQNFYLESQLKVAI
jgi:hypothetical protein